MGVTPLEREKGVKRSPTVFLPGPVAVVRTTQHSCGSLTSHFFGFFFLSRGPGCRGSRFVSVSPRLRPVEGVESQVAVFPWAMFAFGAGWMGNSVTVGCAW